VSDAERVELRHRAALCRATAAAGLRAANETDRLLREMADRLEREADEIEAKVEDD
jgi:hypothetical protein